MAHHAPHGQPRGDEVAEAVAAAGARNVDRGDEEDRVAGELALERRDLVFAGRAREIGEAGADLLQADDVGIGSDTSGFARDARGRLCRRCRGTTARSR
jgi:hypothetical protein